MMMMMMHYCRQRSVFYHPGNNNNNNAATLLRRGFASAALLLQILPTPFRRINMVVTSKAFPVHLLISSFEIFEIKNYIFSSHNFFLGVPAARQRADDSLLVHVWYIATKERKEGLIPNHGYSQKWVGRGMGKDERSTPTWQAAIFGIHRFF